MYVCMSTISMKESNNNNTRTHTHTHKYIHTRSGKCVVNIHTKKKWEREIRIKSNSDSGVQFIFWCVFKSKPMLVCVTACIFLKFEASCRRNQLFL